MDFRSLPDVLPADVLEQARTLVNEALASHDCVAEVETAMYLAPTSTDLTWPVMCLLNEELSREVVNPTCVGLTDATVVALLRQAGLPGCVWSTIFNRPHEPNGSGFITSTLRDARILARLIPGKNA